MNHSSVFIPARADHLSHLFAARTSPSSAVPRATIGSDLDRLAAIGHAGPIAAYEAETLAEELKAPALLAAKFEQVKNVSYRSSVNGSAMAFISLVLNRSSALALTLHLDETILVYLLNPADRRVSEFIDTAEVHGLLFAISGPAGQVGLHHFELPELTAAYVRAYIVEARESPDGNDFFLEDALESIDDLTVYGTVHGQALRKRKNVIQICMVDAAPIDTEGLMFSVSTTFWVGKGKAIAKATRKLEKLTPWARPQPAA